MGRLEVRQLVFLFAFRDVLDGIGDDYPGDVVDALRSFFRELKLIFKN